EAGTSSSVVTSRTGMRAAAMLAIQAPPTLWACTMSTCSEKIRRSRTRAPRLSLNGLTVAFTSGAHSPPHAVSSETSGPSSAATTARAGLHQRGGHVERGAGNGLLAQGRHDLQDGRARQGARVRMAVVVAHGGHSLDRRRLVCRSGILVFNAGRRRNTPDSKHAPKAGFPK